MRQPEQRQTDRLLLYTVGGGFMDTINMVTRREYSKGDQRLALIVRVVSGSDIHGALLRYETWVNNKEDESACVESGDVNSLSLKFYSKLLDLYGEGWKRENVNDCEAKQHAKFFDPAML